MIRKAAAAKTRTRETETEIKARKEDNKEVIAVKTADEAKRSIEKAR